MRKNITARKPTKESKMRKLKLGIIFALIFVMAGAHIFAVSVGI
jgi:hypothetical protein